MPSFVWDRDTKDAWAEPYEYDGQSQFHREASNILSLLKDHYTQKDGKFYRDEETVEKAIWLIQVDALEAITDALKLTEEKRHRIASRLFRDAVETMDTSAYFYLAGDKAKKDIQKWYQNEVIPHRAFRKFIQEFESKDKANQLVELYKNLSKYTHRTYNAIAISYILGHDDEIFYDGFSSSGHRVLPHAISFSYAVIADLIKRFIAIAENTKEISGSKAKEIWEQGLDKETVPRRFGTGAGQILRGPPIKLELK